MVSEKSTQYSTGGIKKKPNRKKSHTQHCDKLKTGTQDGKDEKSKQRTEQSVNGQHKCLKCFFFTNSNVRVVTMFNSNKKLSRTVWQKFEGGTNATSRGIQRHVYTSCPAVCDCVCANVNSFINVKEDIQSRR